jgi:hypothetical protein
MPNNTINISFDILGLQGAERVKNKAGDDCVLIVLPKSRMNAHSNGKVYCSLDVKANKDGEDKFGKTHFCAESSTKEERANKQFMPIIGSGKEFVFGGQNQRQTQRQAPRHQHGSVPAQDHPLMQDSGANDEIPW